MSSLDTTWPKNVTCSNQNSHLENFVISRPKCSLLYISTSDSQLMISQSQFNLRKKTSSFEAWSNKSSIYGRWYLSFPKTIFLYIITHIKSDSTTILTSARYSNLTIDYQYHQFLNQIKNPSNTLSLCYSSVLWNKINLSLSRYLV